MGAPQVAQRILESQSQLDISGIHGYIKEAGICVWEVYFWHKSEGYQRSNGVCASEGQHLDRVVDLHCYLGVCRRFPLFCFMVFISSEWVGCRDEEVVVLRKNYPANLI